MDVYQIMLNRAIKRFMSTQGVNADTLALACGITRGTFYAKLAGNRCFTVRELRALAAHGVPVPPVDADLRRRSK
ncbi:hypothetical protein [Trueperella pyogenes]